MYLFIYLFIYLSLSLYIFPVCMDFNMKFLFPGKYHLNQTQALPQRALS